MKHVAALMFEYAYHIFFNLFFSRLGHFIFFQIFPIWHASIYLTDPFAVLQMFSSLLVLFWCFHTKNWALYSS